jgi:N,N'-diacetylbacillosaminyl-diphospho-undecaprenol alpha-1,3-N-acetylgalactosaminyltransferase
MWSLYRIFSRERCDIVHNHTIKPNIYGTLAARLAGVRMVLCTVHGLGSALGEIYGVKQRVIRNLTKGLYTLAFSLASRVQFLNADDMDFFVSSRMIDRDKAILIRSVGVNLDEYSPGSVDLEHLANLRAELAIDGATQVVLMVARVYWSKGVREFVNAAQVIGATRPVRFLLAGAVDGSRDAVPIEYLNQHESETFRWLNYREDVRELLALCDVAVLPSYYREGVPRNLLEAMAMGKPIVTTDNVGCREVVDQGLNGYLVPVRDSQALAEAIDNLLGDARKRERFGHHSKRKAETEFDERLIVGEALERLYEL